MNKVGRNQPCPCGSGKKYKRCCETESQSTTEREIVRIGPAWIQQHSSRLLTIATEAGVINSTSDDDLLTRYQELTHSENVQKASSDTEEIVENTERLELDAEVDVEVDVTDLGDAASMSDQGELLESTDLAPALRSIHLPASNRRDRRLYSQLKLSLSQSVFEPLEVIEVLRGSGFKVRGVLSKRTIQINQATDATLVEPMEWIYGRVVIFERRAYLLNGWEKVPFKNRKALRSELKEKLELGEDKASLPMLRIKSAQTLNICRTYAQTSSHSSHEAASLESEA